MNIKQDLPYFFQKKVKENNVDSWRTFFALRLLDVENFTTRENNYLEQSVRKQLFEEHTNIINIFYQPEVMHSIEYRIFYSPANGDGENHKIKIYIIVSTDHPNKMKSLRMAKKNFRSVVNTFQSAFEHYSIENVSDEETVHKIFKNQVLLKSICELRRRVSPLSSESLIPRKQLGLIVEKNVTLKKKNKEKRIYLIHPYIPVYSGYEKLFKFLLQLKTPIVISLRISPTKLTPEENQLLLDQIKISDEIATQYPGTSKLTKSQAQYLSGILLSHYLSLQDAPFLLYVFIGTPENMTPGLTELLGYEITQPVGGRQFDIPGTSPEVLAGYSGGFDVFIPKTKKEITACQQALMWHKNDFLPGSNSKIQSERRLQFLFDASEAVSAFHLPFSINQNLTGIPIRWNKVKPAPNELTGKSSSKLSGLIGINNFLGTRKPFYLPIEARRRHMYVVGQTGTGKSSILQSMIIDDIKAGRGVGLIDPHGDLLDYILPRIPEDRLKDVVLIDPSVKNYVVGVNILENQSVKQQSFIIQELLSMARSLFDPNYRHGITGPMFEDTVRIALISLMNYSDTVPSFLEFPLFFYNKSFRRKVLNELKNRKDKLMLGQLLSMSVQSVENMRDYGDFTSYVLSKYGRIIYDEHLRDILCQESSTISFEEIINNEKILLVNLNRALLGKLSAEMLGMFILTKIQAAAMNRTGIPENRRKDFYLYVDEFQNSATDNFAEIFSESRKYRLNLILANQYVDQIPADIRDAIFGNVGTMVSLRVGMKDAKWLITQYEPVFTVEDLVTLPNWQAVVATTATGKRLAPFTIETIPFLTQHEKSKKEIQRLKETLTKQAGMPRRAVRNYIEKRFESVFQKNFHIQGEV